MASLDDLKKTINGRPVLVLLHGGSIEELEKYIHKLKNLDICYSTVNVFPIVEDNILAKIGENFDIVFEASGVINTHNYNEQSRIPRLRRFLDRLENNLWITSKQVIKTIMFNVGNEEFILRYLPKMLITDSINFSLANVPNSSTCLIALMAIGGASKIIICGADGCKEGVENIDTYYQRDLQMKDKTLAGNNQIQQLTHESMRTQNATPTFVDNYCRQYSIKKPPIILCGGYYTMYPKIEYSELKKEIVKET